MTEVQGNDRSQHKKENLLRMDKTGRVQIFRIVIVLVSLLAFLLMELWLELLWRTFSVPLLVSDSVALLVKLWEALLNQCVPGCSHVHVPVVVDIQVSQSGGIQTVGDERTSTRE